jgi:hypothetical protein
MGVAVWHPGRAIFRDYFPEGGWGVGKDTTPKVK